MKPFAKLFEYPIGQLLVVFNHDENTNSDEIIFRSDANGLQIEQKLRLAKGESGEEIFNRVTIENAMPTFEHLQKVGSMGAVQIDEPKYSVFNLAIQVENMRNAQKLYFKTIAKARQTNAPADKEKANQIKNLAILIEKSVDDTLVEILLPVREVIS